MLPGLALQAPTRGTLPASPLESLERSLELWTWLLSVAVLLVEMMDPSRPGTPVSVGLFAGVVAAYNVVAHWALPHRGSSERRLMCHLAFLMVAASLLVTDGAIGHAYLVLFIVPPILGARVLGEPAGWRLLLLGLAGVTVRDVGWFSAWSDHMAVTGLVSHITAQTLLTVVAGGIGIRTAADQLRLMHDLSVTRSDLQRQVQQLRLVHEIGTAIRLSLDLNDILKTTSRELGRALDADRCLILLCDNAGDPYVLHEYNAPGVSEVGTLRGLRLPVVGLAIRQQAPAVVADTGAADLPPGLDCGTMATAYRGLNVRAALAVPIIVGRDVLGAINFQQCDRPRVWTSDEIAFVEAVAGQVAVALVNASAHSALVESEERFRSAFGRAPIGVALTTTDSRWLQINMALAGMLGYSIDELVALGPNAITHPDDLPEQARHLGRLMRGETTVACMEKRYIHRDGHTVWAIVSASAVRDTAGGISHLVVHVQDITERKDVEERLAQLANYDSLTGLFNRRRFQDELQRELEAALRYETSGALLFIDLDQFKFVNDSLGHQAGDELLKGVALLLRHRLRKTDILARLGGDEFAVILPHVSEEQAKTVGRELLDLLRQHVFTVAGQSVTVTASIGVALFPGQGATAEILLTRADMAMYQVKDQGRNGCSVYASEQGELAHREAKLAWERRIKHALACDRFVLLAQPIIGLHDGEVAQYELLIRMLNEDGQPILPGEFLPVAERFGLIHEIDRWVVRRAIALLQVAEQEGRPICVAVNLSGKAFSDPDLLPLIRRELAETGINPASLTLEITETAAIADMALAREFVRTLEGIGCRFTIDDFGTGFSSFNYLKYLPVHFLKIDGSFIKDLASDTMDQHTVRAIVELARGFGRKTIAEYVSDDRTVALLREFGVDYAQGFHLGAPAPLPDVIKVKVAVD